MQNIKNRTSTTAKGVVARLLVVLALLLMLGGCMTACGGGRATLTLEPAEIKEAEITEENNLTAAQLNDLANAIAENKNGLEIRERLVAASRGYDMLAEGFDDDNLPEAQPDKAGEFAGKVIKLDTYEIKKGLENEVLATYDKINSADVKLLVEAFKTPVSTESDLNFFDMIFHWVALGFAWLIKYPGFGYFALGLIYFSIFVELIMLPMGINQQKNSRKQALLRPKEMAIRKKYAGRNDQVTQQKVSQEIQEMYQKEGFNPMSGCLPLLLSLVIIIPLYNLVIDPMKYMMGASSDLSAALHYFATASKAAGGLGIDLTSSNGTIELLSKLNVADVWEGMSNFAFYSNGQHCVGALQEMLGVNGELIPKFTILGLNFGLTPSLENPWLITVPVMTFVSYFASMKLSRKHSYQPVAQDQATGCSNKMMDFMMPAMSVWFTFMVPAAVGLYWVFKSLIGMVKSVIISKLMPLPVFTEADFKAAEREMAAKEKNRPVKKNSGGNPNVRSLHHIDDDEDELPPLPERPTTYVEDEEETPAASGEYLGDATIKEDDRPTPKKKDKKKKKGEETPADSDFASHDDDF